METRKIILIGLIILAVSLGRAQNKDSTICLRKNEIGIGIGPLMLISLGSQPSSQPIGISYKRVVNKWVLKTSFAYSRNSNSPFGFNSHEEFHNDSTISIRTTNYYRNTFSGRIGAEYRYAFKNGITIFGGTDLIAQYSNGTKNINEALFRIDSLVGTGTAQQHYEKTFLDVKAILIQRETSPQFGLGINLGVLFPLKQRWWLAFSYRADAVFGNVTVKRNDLLQQKTETNNFSRFDFNSGPLLSELALFYRF